MRSIHVIQRERPGTRLNLSHDVISQLIVLAGIFSGFGLSMLAQVALHSQQLGDVKAPVLLLTTGVFASLSFIVFGIIDLAVGDDHVKDVAEWIMAVLLALYILSTVRAIDMLLSQKLGFRNGYFTLLGTAFAATTGITFLVAVFLSR